MPKTLPVIDTTAPVCCAPVAAAPMGEGAAVEVALRLKALADPVRLRLMSLLLASDEMCTCDMAPAVGLTEATVSHHLAQLRKNGLIEGERRGTNVYYRARREALGALVRVMDPTAAGPHAPAAVVQPPFTLPPRAAVDRGASSERDVSEQ